MTVFLSIYLVGSVLSGVAASIAHKRGFMRPKLWMNQLGGLLGVYFWISWLGLIVAVTKLIKREKLA